ncbi:hypothetical protein [uncultured Psychrosphaera sp.]|uniref:hypothetical protein n=1 Tax=uncultured Psychrosphaera sp. TaxID=1403522 RepID=UPI0026025334|nr:hypothetical protein [uncultured Psychrosphaera sp.]
MRFTYFFYCLLVFLAGSIFGGIFISNESLLNLLAQAGSIVSALAGVFTAGVALFALNSWKAQEKYKNESQLCLEVFESLSEIETNAIIYARELIRIKQKNSDVDTYLNEIEPYSQALSKYSKIHARAKFEDFTDLLKILDKTEKLNSEINEIISNENSKNDTTSAELFISARNNLNRIFKKKLTRITAINKQINSLK